VRFFPSKAECCPAADKTLETAVFRDVPRGRPVVRKSAKQIHHIKYLGGTYPEGHELAGVPIARRWWHWSDQTDLIDNIV
jgi:hypothetical protein